MKTNERCIVRWQFLTRPEYLTVDTKLIIREGTTKGMGTVTRIFDFANPSDPQTAAAAMAISGDDGSLKENKNMKHKSSPSNTSPTSSPRAFKMAKKEAIPVLDANNVETENKDPLVRA